VATWKTKKYDEMTLRWDLWKEWMELALDWATLRAAVFPRESVPTSVKWCITEPPLSYRADLVLELCI